MLALLPPTAAEQALCQSPDPGVDGNRAEIESLVDLAIEAYGGRQALASTMNMVQRGSVTSSMRGGTEGRFLRIYQRPIRLRVEIAYPGVENEERILDGGRGWRNGGRTDGALYQAMLLQAARLGMPALLDDFRSSLEDLGTVERGGRTLQVLGMEFHRGLEVRVEIDPESGRVLRSEGTMEGPGGDVAVSFATDYSDFREVDGALVPFHEVNWAQGTKTGRTQLEKVEFPSEPPAGAFHPSVRPEHDPDGDRVRT